MFERSSQRIRSLLPGALLAAVLAACAGGPSAASPSVLLPAGGAIAADDVSITVAGDAPPEREPDFDLVGPVWDIEAETRTGDVLLTIELPLPGDPPADVATSQLSIATYQPAAGDNSAFWTTAEEVDVDLERGTVSTKARGFGLFAVAAPNDYWTAALSREGNFKIRYVSRPEDGEGVTPEHVSLLGDELEAARQWIVASGYPEPNDTLGGPQPVYIVPLRGGPGLVEPSRLGSALKLSDRLQRSPETIAAAVTHELFHLSQRRAMSENPSDGAWIREATAEYVAVQRLGLAGARAHIDESCENYKRSLTDTRGINEYHNWTFVAFMEGRQPGFVGRLLDSEQPSEDGLDALRELAGAPLNRLLADYAASYRLLQDFPPLKGGISCPGAQSVDLAALDGRAYHLPPLAGLVVQAEIERPSRLTLTIERSGHPEAMLWGFYGERREELEPTEAGPGARLVYQLDCEDLLAAGDSGPLERIALIFGAGEQVADIQITATPGEAC